MRSIDWVVVWVRARGIATTVALQLPFRPLEGLLGVAINANGRIARTHSDHESDKHQVFHEGDFMAPNYFGKVKFLPASWLNLAKNHLRQRKMPLQGGVSR